METFLDTVQKNSELALKHFSTGLLIMSIVNILIPSVCKRVDNDDPLDKLKVRDRSLFA